MHHSGGKASKLRGHFKIICYVAWYTFAIKFAR